MVDVRPFHGLRFNSSRVQDVSLALSPPYDVISPTQHDELLARSPYNIARVELPSPDFQSSTSSGGDDPYQKAARTLEAWRSENVLIRDESPCLYLYEVTFCVGDQELARRSLVAALRLEPWDSKQVLPHEQTMQAPKADRLRLLQATRANVSPIWTLYRGRSDALVRAWDWTNARPPEVDAALEDGTRHRVWKLDEPGLVDDIRTDFVRLRLVIADGHHRYETALSYRDEVVPGGESGSDDPANFVLAHLVAEDDPGLAILPTHRLVRQLGRLDQVELEEKLGHDWHGEYFPIWDGAPPEQLDALLAQLASEAQSERVIGLYGPDMSIFAILILRNKQIMEQRAPERSEAWRDLDVALLEEGVLKPLLEQADADREHAVAYERHPYAAMQAVLSGEYQLALFLNALKPDQVVSVAEAGDRMPEKSTYFYPKIPTGLVIRELMAKGTTSVLS
jgi:uncharacterized protein (DUF1015 family)